MKLYDLVVDPSKLATYGKFISPQEAYERLQQGDTTPYLVKAVASDSKWAYYYARHIINGRWPEGEKAIASDPHWAYLYAYGYALDIIKGRFLEGEKTIANDSYWAKLYQEFLDKIE